ncbi:PREDICTED: RNA polymerase II-associated protein 3-like isoform X2 [Amphimedon queenslandica]|uniref:RNA polymerase II-associated protein 3 n=1 Tax=Amphimedon queenslandica TaxID=400682 RepID=A0A1X7UVC5_AMPQE|nr:PREDICTED: RNA polymerase II-associated protein 3-like isoform X2 [Amphimedon queenslandica]|eukprot:XP_011403927.2 PREDICTED: RNA polymerase II-associated protein 3-like isoform X2 [Amphimedon queenslandica]
MAVDPTLLQMQLKRNNEDMRDMLQSLDSWEEEIKKRDELLKKQKPILKKTLPPIRGKSSGDAPHKKKPEPAAKKKEKIKSFDYDAWSKFDVDEACEDSDSRSSEGEEENEENEENSRRETAVLEKERGNQLFKDGKYEAAIERYTAAINLDPLSAVLPANRAMALLKLDRYAAAEKDCDVSISLDDKYVKAWMRRAAAKTKLKKYESATEDIKMVLQLEPTNKHAKAELERLEKLKGTSDDRKYVHPVKRPPHLRSKEPLVRIHIEDISTTAVTSEPVSDAAAHEEEEERRVEETNTIELTESMLYEAPTSSIQFQCQWKTLRRSDPSKLAQYFKAILPSQYPVVLKQSLENETFSDIIDILDKEYIQRSISCFDELEWMRKVERFSVAILFLSSKDKLKLKNIFDGLSNLCDRKKVSELASHYTLSL